MRSQNYGPSCKNVLYKCINLNYLQWNYLDGSEERPPNPICVLGSCYCSQGYEYDEERGECKFVPTDASSSTYNLYTIF
jgi:hypothetical protein